MLCDDCLKNNATIHLTTFVNGQVKTVHLCAQCAAKRNKPSAAADFSLNDLFSAFYEADEAAASICGNCGTSLADFQKTGRLGCSECYKAFESSIIPVLKGIHINVRHTGKRPGQHVIIDVEKDTENERRKEELKRDLRLAVSLENFEEAARLRDEIALMEKESEKNA